MRIARFLLALLALGVAAAAGSVWFFPERVLDASLAFARAAAGLERKELALADGTRIVYLEGGAGEPLVLLHGFGATKDHFVPVARYLVAHYRAIVPDLPGFGESSRAPQADYAPPAQAARMHEFARALGLARPHVGASSMGGHVALTWAALYPREVASLWLLAPGGLWSAPASEVRRMIEREGRNPLLPQSEEDFARLAALVAHDAPYVPRPLLDAMARRRLAHRELERRIFGQLVADSVEARIRGLATPALAVWGERDRVIHPAAAEVLRGLMPQTRVALMPEVGHLPMIERPADTAAEYLRFRASLAN